MEASQMKNMIVLKNLPSNIVDEAIVIIKNGKKAKKVQKVEKNKKIVDLKKENDNQDYVIREAESIIENYISNIENKTPKIVINKNLTRKYKNLRKYAIIVSAICILQAIVILF